MVDFQPIAAVLIPVIVDEIQLRVLSPGPNLWSASGGALIFGLTAFVVLLALGVRHARPGNSRRERELESLARFELTLAESSDPTLAATHALDIVLEFTHAAAAQLWVQAEPTASLTSLVHRGLFPESFAPPDAVPLEFVQFTELDKFPLMRARNFVELAQLPLVARGRVVGVLEIAARHHGELDKIPPTWFKSVASSLAATLADALELARVRTQLVEEKRLWQAGLEVTATENYDELLRTIMDRARELIGGQASALCLWDAEKRWWVVQGTSGVTDAFEVSLSHFERNNGDRVECPVVRFRYRHSHLDLPLQRNGQIIGCLCVANQEPREYAPDERARLAGIADQAALAVERTRLLETMGSRAAHAERERLGREIHDTLAQILGFVNMKTGAARDLLTQGKADQALLQLDQLSLLSQELYQDTRELILGLHNQVETAQGLVPALQSYVERFSQFSTLPTTFEAPDDLIEFTPAVQVQLIRVVQEALSNVRKHAHAQHAWVTLTREEDRVVLAIRDDGQGFDPSRPGRGFGPRFGLQSMRERVQSIHGTFELSSMPGQGTTLRVETPLIYRGQSL